MFRCLHDLPHLIQSFINEIEGFIILIAILTIILNIDMSYFLSNFSR